VREDQTAPTPLRERSVPGMHAAVFETIGAIGLEPSSRILDCGAGTGAWISRLLSAGLRDVTALGLDREDYQGAAPFVTADLNEPFAHKLTGPYDLITAIEVIEHLESAAHFLRECRSLLKPDGRLVLTTPNIECAPGRLKFLRSGEFRWFDSHGDPTHITPISRALLGRIASRCGFAVESDRPAPGRLWTGSAAWKTPICAAMTFFFKGDLAGDCRVFVLR
jgi:cyclopropane fatty-acyl-phospholipid synthase-like methyltransferase